MRIHTNGYLGIGTDNPKTPLHIPEQGLQIGTSAQASDNFHIVSDLTGNTRGFRLFNGNYGVGTHLLTVLANGNVGIGTTNPSVKLNIDPQGNGGIIIGNPNTGSGGYTSFTMGISAQSDGYATLQCIRKSGSSWGDISLNPAGGNIGIGTKSPQAKLDIAGNIRCGTSQTVNKETSITFSGLNGDVDKIYELRLFGRMGTAGTNKNIRLGPNKIFDTSGFRNITHRFYEVGNKGNSDLDIRNNGGLTLGFTDWNADGDIFIMARFYAATGKSRALEATHLYTNSASGADRELRGDHIGWWSDIKTNITSLVIDFNGGTFTGTALLTTVQP
jgi:hypothetical protein